MSLTTKTVHQELVLLNKLCPKCGINKPIDEFYNNYSYCKECSSKLNLEYHRKNKKDTNKRHTAWKRGRTEENKELLKEYLGDFTGSKCGIKDECIEIYDFHHIDPSKKKFAIGNGYRKTWEDLKNEVDKCILLCANCHRKEHLCH